MLDPVHEPGNAEEPLSPELALIDPEAADRARRRLPAIELFEDRLLTLGREPTEAKTALIEPALPAASRVAFRRRRAATILAVTLAGAGVLGAAYLIDRGGTRPVAKSPSDERLAEVLPALHGASPAPHASGPLPPAPPTPASADPTRTTAGTSSARTLPAFAWPQAPHAHEYRITFTSGDRVVYSASTTTTQLHVAPKRLPAGIYRWRVFALDGAGRPIGTPVIDSMLTVH